MRTGPLVRRGGKVSRVTPTNSAAARACATATIFSRHPPELTGSAGDDLFKTSRLRLDYRLPINLREFLAVQLGTIVEESEETVLNLAATADETTLSRLARAIRRYSTTRAQQAWEECAVPLARFAVARPQAAAAAALCLKCQQIEFGDGAVTRHQSGACVSLALGAACEVRERLSANHREVKVADTVRRLVEEFRAERVAYGLPHFDLDCYVRNGQITFTWRPLL